MIKRAIFDSLSILGVCLMVSAILLFAEQNKLRVDNTIST